MNHQASPAPHDSREPAGADDIDNGEHKGAKTVENPGPGTPGNAEGAIDGGGDSRTAEERAEQSTVSSPSPGSTGP